MLNHLCEEINQLKLHGCQILEYIASRKSGDPLITSIFQRFLFFFFTFLTLRFIFILFLSFLYRLFLRLRIIFIKQTIGWMLYGVLSDESNEFFIQSKSNSNPKSSDNSSSNSIQETSFDWFHSYQMNYLMLPESVISLSLATKIFFSGKVIKLIKKLKLNYDEKYRDIYQHQQNDNNETQFNSNKQNSQWNSRNNLYHYFGLVSYDHEQKNPDVKQQKNADGELSDEDIQENENELEEKEYQHDEVEKNGNMDGINESNIESMNNSSHRRSIIDQYTTPPVPSNSNKSFPSQDIFQVPEFIERIFNESLPHPSLASVSLQYLQIISDMYQKILLSWDICLIKEEIEKLIEFMHSLSSNELWKQMIASKNGSGITIYQQLEFMRNTYLLGKGEFYQVFAFYLITFDFLNFILIFFTSFFLYFICIY